MFLISPDPVKNTKATYVSVHIHAREDSSPCQSCAGRGHRDIRAKSQNTHQPCCDYEGKTNTLIIKGKKKKHSSFHIALSSRKRAILTRLPSAEFQTSIVQEN